jgi:hypothetical protein
VFSGAPLLATDVAAARGLSGPLHLGSLSLTSCRELLIELANIGQRWGGGERGGLVVEGGGIGLTFVKRRGEVVERVGSRF